MKKKLSVLLLCFAMIISALGLKAYADDYIPSPEQNSSAIEALANDKAGGTGDLDANAKNMNGEDGDLDANAKNMNGENGDLDANAKDMNGKRDNDYGLAPKTGEKFPFLLVSSAVIFGILAVIFIILGIKRNNKE